MKKILILILITTAFITNIFADNLKTFPKATVITLDEQPFSISNIDTTKSKITLIAFWATWCNPCISELKKLKKIKKKFNIPIIYINEDEPKSFDQVEPFVKTRRINSFTVLWDKNKELYNALGLNGIPQIYIIDNNFNILYSHNGYQKGDEKELQQHIEELLK